MLNWNTAWKILPRNHGFLLKRVMKGIQRYHGTETVSGMVTMWMVLRALQQMLYVRDIDQCLCPDSQLVTFADDTTVYSLAHSVTLCQSTASLQRSLNSLYEWGQRWRIRFEPSKTQRLIICRRRTTTPVPILTFGNVPIETTDKLKLLGITFDPTLSFRPYLHNLAVRANRRLAFLRKAGRVLDKAGRMAAYKGFIRPLLEYAPLAWLGAAQTHLVALRYMRLSVHTKRQLSSQLSSINEMSQEGLNMIGE